MIPLREDQALKSHGKNWMLVGGYLGDVVHRLPPKIQCAPIFFVFTPSSVQMYTLSCNKYETARANRILPPLVRGPTGLLPVDPISAGHKVFFPLKILVKLR